MAEIGNIYLFLIGVAIAAVGTLGFVVFFSNRKSITSRTFLLFSLISIAWNICNYLVGQNISHEFAIWALRGTMFFAVWYCFYIFQLLYVFPEESFSFSSKYKLILVPAVGLVSLLTLTSLVFEKISSYTVTGVIGTVVNGPGVYVFGLTVTALIAAALWILIRKSMHATGDKMPLIFVLVGTALTFALYLVFNFILPAFFNRAGFIQLGAVFTFPFVAFTAYAIIKHHLLNIKVFAAQALTFVLSVTTLAEVIIARDLATILFQSAVFLLVLSFGILLIQSIQREVEQREELQRLNEQIEGLSHFKTQLLSLASHQLKSPLAAIKGFAGLLSEGQMGTADEKGKETLGKIIKSADSLIALINTLLDLRKVDEGKMDYQFVRVDLRKLVQDMFDMLKPLAEAKHLEFTLAMPEREVWVNADAEKLKQVIQNLTDNAIKYTPGGFVRVTLATADARATVSVSDSGVGISAELVPHLFEEFVRDERVKKQILGTGLGLYIARRIAEAHGGKIRAASSGEGKGSTFSVEVPEVA